MCVVRDMEYGGGHLFYTIIVVYCVIKNGRMLCMYRRVLYAISM